jgi:5-methylcytosine-specific restriction enzyme subunit McrC
MNNPTGIPIRNIFYMLSYAYRSLKIEDESSYSTETFKNLTELYTELLIISTTKIVKRGMWKEYREVKEDSTFIRGKIDIGETMGVSNTLKHKIAVQYDELTENNLLNQILKSALLKLAIHGDTGTEHRKKLRNLLVFFTGVEEITLNSELWSHIRFTNQNMFYQLPIDLCQYLYEGLLVGEDGYSHNQQEIKDEQQLSSLFEKFVFNFYRKETDYKVYRPQINWDTAGGYSEGLPVMKTDVVLKKGANTLIIDTKFYQQNMTSFNEKSSLKHLSGNMYQIFSYLENYNEKEEETVSGLLLYAKTNTAVQPNHSYMIKGKNIRIETLDLSLDFHKMKGQLLEMAERSLK